MWRLIALLFAFGLLAPGLSQVTYSIKRGSTHGTGEFHSEMEAVHLDAGGEKKQVASPVNLTNHAYWNLSGNCRRSVRDHGLLLRCDRYLPLDDYQVCVLCVSFVVLNHRDFEYMSCDFNRVWWVGTARWARLVLRMKGVRKCGLFSFFFFFFVCSVLRIYS